MSRALVSASSGRATFAPPRQPVKLYYAPRAVPVFCPAHSFKTLPGSGRSSVSPNSLKAQIRRLMPRTLRAHRILGGPLRGCRIVTSWHDYPGAILGRTERALLEWFERHVIPGTTWLDVGAHYGYTAIALARLVGSRGGGCVRAELTTAMHAQRAGESSRATTVLPSDGRCGLARVGALPVRGWWIGPADGRKRSRVTHGSPRLALGAEWGEQRRIDEFKSTCGMELETLEDERVAPRVHTCGGSRGSTRGDGASARSSGIIGYARWANRSRPGARRGHVDLDDRSYWSQVIRLTPDERYGGR